MVQVLLWWCKELYIMLSVIIHCKILYMAYVHPNNLDSRCQNKYMIIVSPTLPGQPKIWH